MSYTTVKAVWPGEKHSDLEELSNSWGSAPIVWNCLCGHLYGSKDCGYFTDGSLERLWPRWKDLSIPKHQRAVLMMTYDRAYVSKKDYQRAAADIKQFFLDFPPDPGRVNHWPRIREIFLSDPDIPAIGFHCTSSSEDPWAGPWNEDKEEYDSTNWGECFDVYEQLGCAPKEEGA